MSYLEGIHSYAGYQGEFGYCCDKSEHERGHFVINIYKASYLACEQCRKVRSIGHGVFGDWWDETEKMWQARWEHIEHYDFIDEPRACFTYRPTRKLIIDWSDKGGDKSD